MLLPGNEHTFHVKVQGEVTKEWFEGDFTCICVLTNNQQMEVAIRSDRYNAGSKTLPEQFKLFNRTMSELELRVKKGPTWWVESNNGWDLHDANVVYEVFNKAMEGQTAWAEKLKSKADEAEKLAEKHPAKKAKKDEEATG